MMAIVMHQSPKNALEGDFVITLNTEKFKGAEGFFERELGDNTFQPLPGIFKSECKLIAVVGKI